MLLKSKSLTIKRWELKDVGISKLPGLEKELKNVIEIGLNETYWFLNYLNIMQQFGYTLHNKIIKVNNCE